MNICDFHFAWTGDLEPTGEPCGKPATRIIKWPESSQYSLACDDHASPASFADTAPAHYVSPWVDK